MKPGPKPKTATQRPRAAPGVARVKLPLFDQAPRAPIMPDYLANDSAMEPARAVWAENLERVTDNGCHEGDSDLFARYCIQEAAYRAHVRNWLTGESENDPGPKAAAIESLRKMGELLGIAGPTSRQRMPVKMRPAGNAFHQNGVRK